MKHDESHLIALETSVVTMTTRLRVVSPRRRNELLSTSAPNAYVSLVASVTNASSVTAAVYTAQTTQTPTLH